RHEMPAQCSRAASGSDRFGAPSIKDATMSPVNWTLVECARFWRGRVHVVIVSIGALPIQDHRVWKTVDATDVGVVDTGSDAMSLSSRFHSDHDALACDLLTASGMRMLERQREADPRSDGKKRLRCEKDSRGADVACAALATTECDRERHRKSWRSTSFD